MPVLCPRRRGSGAATSGACAGSPRSTSMLARGAPSPVARGSPAVSGARVGKVCAALP